MNFDIIVIGSGPSGLFSAIMLAKNNKKVLIIERNEKIGGKLFIAGSGQCNITHTGNYKDFLEKYGENGKFLKRVLYKFSPQDTIDFFNKNGLKLIKREDGKYFPETFKSIDVINLLLKEYKGEYRVKELVKEIKKLENEFIVKTDKLEYKSKYVIVATGGKSYKKIGTTGDGYKFAKSFGHQITKIVPALTPIFVNNYIFFDLSGISFKNIEMKILKKNKIYKKVYGDLLFTHKNLSGPIIINNSRNIEKNDFLEFNFVKTDREILENEFIDNQNNKKKIKTILLKYDIPERFINKILKILDLEYTKIADLSKENRKKILDMFCNYRFKVSKLDSFEKAMVTKGGIELKELDKNTLESKLIKNLYFVGEVIDIDGDTGGYNIQAAISMGVAAARDIIEK
ncbi:hypothetical protein EV215_0393 [Hypnocyclicus thermotrophus]|uniref:Uncharacterized protein n=1 Tax=Hypnocyclicus thermotrophus TaxID=1627895 RepID=A0AA46E1N0_9FUSO|nr:NAD(P)/FAD-dependent oxidoreductase [Hypnocyclicus thermotrophus]TDT72583.1 hypothetical protein EV215_0393 [Hypnocyclicus thermotrophus]